MKAAYRNSDGTLATEGAWSLPCRVDAIPASENSAEPAKVDSQTRLEFEPIHFRLGDSAVERQPFVWDWLSLQVQGLAEEKASNALIDWFNDWFDRDDENEPDKVGLQQVVHFMSDPQVLAEGVKATMGLGSATVEGLEDLLLALSYAGAAQLRLASFRTHEKNRSLLRFFSSQRMAPALWSLSAIRSWQSPCTD
ncbi:hypothetical protein [Comamonas testosteroni]|uniref:hypothetical protein n=1 Tax=Comamonas testosteroni TaxID=285 RepID=UPI0028EFF324|nr:hypothetical protein [Comamonas testosteroni]